MSFWVKQAFVRRDEIRAPLKSAEWEANQVPLGLKTGMGKKHVFLLSIEVKIISQVSCVAVLMVPQIPNFIQSPPL